MCSAALMWNLIGSRFFLDLGPLSLGVGQQLDLRIGQQTHLGIGQQLFLIDAGISVVAQQKQTAMHLTCLLKATTLETIIDRLGLPSTKEEYFLSPNLCPGWLRVQCLGTERSSSHSCCS